jgi:hypothetical protein
MIKSSELRIGNIVWESSSFTPGPDDFEEIVVGAINDIDKVVLDDQNNIYSYDYLYTIPLTPEWLERCGFEKVTFEGVSAMNGGRGWDREGVELANEFMSGEWKIVYNTRKDSIEIEHLHQLQNLYFAVTGEDIKMK